MRHRFEALAVLLALVLTGCGGSTPPADEPAVPWLLAESPPGAMPVAEAKASGREGERVVVRGRIGGRADPLSRDVAVFVMMDPAVPSCRDRGDACRMPWDYCCETPEDILANSATVQLVDDGRSPLAIDLAAHGFAPLDEVVVVGTVGPRPTAGVFVIQATRLHRVSG